MNEKLTTQDLTDLLAAKHGMTKKDAEAFVKEFFLLIEQALENDKNVKIKGLGTFKLIGVDSRESVNINTGERFQIKGHTKVSFLPDTNLRDTINKPFAHFETVVLNENTVLEDTPVDEGEEEDEDVVIEEVAEDGLEDMDKKEATETESIASVVEPVVEEIAENNPAAEPEAVSTEQPQEESQEENKVVAEEVVSVKAEQQEPTAAHQQIRWGEHLTPAKEKSYVPYLIAVIVAVLLVCGGMVLLMYYPDVFSFASQEATETNHSVSVSATQSNALLTDSIEQKDTVMRPVAQDAGKDVLPNAAETELKQDAARVEPKAAASTPTPAVTVATSSKHKNVETGSKVENKQPLVYSDSASYKIVGTKTKHTIKAGETLTRVSLRYYGTKAMWPYIVKHNKAVIKNPDNVPYGTTIRIPELAKE